MRTGRLLLRRWEDSDLPAFFDLYSREDVARWLGQHPRRALATLDEARERLRQWHVLEQGLDPPLGRWAIVPLNRFPRQEPVGIIPLLPVTDPRGPAGQVEVGWHLHPDHQGQGLVTEAAGAILAAAAEAGIEQVIALTDPEGTESLLTSCCLIDGRHRPDSRDEDHDRHTANCTRRASQLARRKRS